MVLGFNKKFMNSLKVGDKAPDFVLMGNDGEKFTLKKALGKWLVLYFYPKDNTPGCTMEACDFRDYSKEFSKVKALIWGISTDSLESHKKFAERHHLPFPLLADTEKDVVEKYGVWKQKSMFGIKYLGVERTTFVIDPKGKIAHIFAKVKVSNHYEEVLNFITENS